MKSILSIIACASLALASANTAPIKVKAEGTPIYGVPNAPIIIQDTRIITLEAVGLGVAPEKTISRVQAVALAKRAAIIDAYRQMGEKLHGLKIEAKDRMVNSVLQDSVVNTRLNSLVKNANVVDSTYEDGLFQVRMELKIDGERWQKILTMNDPR